MAQPISSPIKLVALDLDGTIVNEDLKISERTQKLLQHVITQTDTKVVIATGRMFLSALPFARQLTVKEPLVAYQGAMIRHLSDGHQMHYHNPIPMPLAQTLMQFLLEREFHINLYMEDELWTSHTNSFATYYATTAGVTPIFTENLMDAMTQPPTKLMVIDDFRVDGLLDELNTHFHGRLTYCRSRSNFCEMIDASCSKWKALEYLIGDWDIKPEEVMAIGDQGNDVSMLQGAGIGVAMGNAPDEVKALANYVTLSVDEDGAAEAIEKFVLNNQTVPV